MSYTLQRIKCRIGLHDYGREKYNNYDGIILQERGCVWCKEQDIAVLSIDGNDPYPTAH